MPPNVTEIKDGTFFNCQSLTTFDCASHIDTIGYGAFSGCVELTTLNIDGVVSIGECAFEDCIKLTELNVDKTTTSIGKKLLIGADNIAAVNVHPDNTSYSSASGALVSLKDNRVMYMPPKSELTEYTFPADIVSVDEYAFNNCIGLKSVIVSYNLREIGSYAFNLCDYLESIRMPVSPDNTVCEFPDTLT